MKWNEIADEIKWKLSIKPKKIWKVTHDMKKIKWKKKVRKVKKTDV